MWSDVRVWMGTRDWRTTPKECGHTTGIMRTAEYLPNGLTAQDYLSQLQLGHYALGRLKRQQKPITVSDSERFPALLVALPARC